MSDKEGTSNATKSAVIDPTNPYNIHHSDQPGHMLVSTKLNDANYQFWKTTMVHELTTKKKLGFVDGTIEMSSQEKDPSQFELWDQCNSMILSWLSHSIEAEIAAWVIHAKTARQVWEDLRDQFGQKNGPAIFQIQKAITTMSQGTMSVASYYIKLKALWDELELYRSPIVCNKEHQIEKEEDKLMQFLVGLNDSFKTIRSNILIMNPLPNVRQAYSLIVQEETQQQMNSDPGENFSIATSVQCRSANWKQSKGKTCEHGNKPGHTIDECRTLKFHCIYRDKRGHTEDRCRIKNGTWNSNGRHGQQQRIKNNPKSSHSSATNMANSSSLPHDSNESDRNLVQGFTAEQIQQLAKAIYSLNNNGKSEVFINAAGLFARNSSINSAFTKPWILDSGATDHIASDSQFFTHTSSSFIPNVNLPIGSTAATSSTHTIKFNDNITLKDDLATGRMIGSDVTFHESVFPFCQHSQMQSSHPLLDILSAIDIDLPTLVQHSLDPPSYPTEPPADQPSSPTPGSPAPITEPSPANLPVRRSSRTSTPPSWLQDYVMGSQANHLTTAQDRPNGTRYPMHHFLSSSRFSSTHSAYLANITTTKEPHTYAQVILDPNWQKAMDEELSALQLNQTWILTSLPAGQKPIKCKWLYKIKYNSDVSVDRYKARLVENGYTQIECVDYSEIFSPTAKLTTLRCLLTIAVTRNWFTHQLDVQNSFLHDTLHELATRASSTEENIVCRLNKSLYGLKQASHVIKSARFQ
ncbi:uncharacterized protein [Phaseolus vulgaris]|uniref:uncharacterized protein n=1 Tax=Phaseolus vulgaris TaxID=3885 RepID=UPI0035CC5B9B